MQLQQMQIINVNIKMFDVVDWYKKYMMLLTMMYLDFGEDKLYFVIKYVTF